MPMFIKKSDEKLIEQALDGSQSSWVKLVKRYEGLVYNYCLRMTFQQTDAMDLMQEVFLAVYRNLPAYRGDGQFKAWMMRIAANKTADFLRARGRNPLYQAGEVEHDKYHSSSSPEAEYQQFSQNREILKMLSTLSEEQRMVVELKFFQHFTFEEISQQTGVAISTIKTRLYSALQKLKGQMEVQNAL
ncbi:RNA polymerase sigma factor [Aliikangiella sp. G2MR2-5]|uniref:RNA polymerase sigma factor n=1 Tax=Aliikangiella sp. G2MR2-5 TaxID=2788943 RepID=UPI0018AC466E|nr:sigma-70 family RNA polymerase sigma factor [Aliikangiella sp. G2MR2-5]